MYIHASLFPDDVLSSAAFQTAVIFRCLCPLTHPVSFPSLHYADSLMLFDSMCYLQPQLQSSFAITASVAA